MQGNRLAVAPRISCLARLLAVGWLAGFAAAAPAADEGAVDPLLAHIHRFEEQAAAAPTAHCEFTVTYLPTKPAARKIIRAANQHRAQTLDRYVLSTDEARRASYRSVWKRKGALSREERTYANGLTERLVLRRNAEVVEGVNLIQPYSFVFEYRGLPLDEWIRFARRREIARGKVNGQRRTQISLVAGTEDWPLVVLMFDEEERLISREIYLDERNYLIQLTRQKPMLHTRHEFSDHKAYRDARGNKLWIPSQAMLRYYLGETSDGVPLEKYAIRVEIEKIELGGKLSDKEFRRAVVPRALRAKAPIPAY